jgi:hypothetical protein
LAEERTVGVQQAVAWIVDVGCFRGHAVDFKDLECLAALECSHVGYPYVVATEIETIEPTRKVVEGRQHRRSFQLGSVEEDGAAAVRAKIDELNGLTRCGDVIEPFGIRIEVCRCHCDGSRVVEYQILEVALTIADDFGHLLLGYREDLAAGLIGVLNVEHTKLGSRSVGLNQSIDGQCA